MLWVPMPFGSTWTNCGWPEPPWPGCHWKISADAAMSVFFPLLSKLHRPCHRLHAWRLCSQLMIACWFSEPVACTAAASTWPAP